MPQGRISASYARALLGWASAKGLAPQAYLQSERLLQLLEGNPQLQQLLMAPISPLSKKQQAVGNVILACAPLLEGIVSLMVRNRREGALRNTLLLFQTFYRKQYGIAQVKIQSAIELEPQSIETIRSYLARSLGRTIEMECHTEPGLIGGFVLAIENDLMDKSVRTELARIRERIAKMSY